MLQCCSLSLRVHCACGSAAAERGILVSQEPPAVQRDLDLYSVSTETPLMFAGYGSGIYNSAKFYSSNGMSQSQYRGDLGRALRGSGASAAAASSGKRMDRLHGTVMLEELHNARCKCKRVLQARLATNLPLPQSRRPIACLNCYSLQDPKAYITCIHKAISSHNYAVVKSSNTFRNLIHSEGFFENGATQNVDGMLKLVQKS